MFNVRYFVYTYIFVFFKMNVTVSDSIPAYMDLSLSLSN